MLNIIFSSNKNLQKSPVLLIFSFFSGKFILNDMKYEFNDYMMRGGCDGMLSSKESRGTYLYSEWMKLYVLGIHSLLGDERDDVDIMKGEEGTRRDNTKYLKLIWKYKILIFYLLNEIRLPAFETSQIEFY